MATRGPCTTITLHATGNTSTSISQRIQRCFTTAPSKQLIAFHRTASHQTTYRLRTDYATFHRLTRPRSTLPPRWLARACRFICLRSRGSFLTAQASGSLNSSHFHQFDAISRQPLSPCRRLLTTSLWVSWCCPAGERGYHILYMLCEAERSLIEALSLGDWTSYPCLCHR